MTAKNINNKNVQGGGALRNCDFEDDLCSWTPDSELNRFQNIKKITIFMKIMKIGHSPMFLIDIDVLIFVFSTEAFVWNRVKGSEEDGQSGPMFDHHGKTDGE